MARFSFGEVYYHHQLAGILQQEPGETYTFTYDSDYLQSDYPAIAYTLPKQKEPFLSRGELHPFFDNLVAEGWLENAQIRMLSKPLWSRFELLLAFGADCAGSVSVIDPRPAHLSADAIDPNDPREIAVLYSRTSLAGVQPKIAIIKEGKNYRPARIGEVSTHIAKFSSMALPDILGNEFLTLTAMKALLPDDVFVEAELTQLEGFSGEVLLVKRFDRGANVTRIHFEEFTSILGLRSEDKYEGGYGDMSKFILNAPDCLADDNLRLFKRIIAGFLVGNTDMHLKNFAMFREAQGMRLTPSYDLISAALYQPYYQQLALSIANTAHLSIGSLRAKHIIRLGLDFKLSLHQIGAFVSELESRLDLAKEAVVNADVDHPMIKARLTDQMQRRWNGAFSLVDLQLSRRRR